MKTIKLILITIWLSLASFLSAEWIAFTAMCITGHSKGYAYDVGSEKDMSVLFGVGLAIIWMVAVIPAMIWLCAKCYRYKKSFISLPFIGFTLLFVTGIFSMGLNSFIGYFGVGTTPFH